MQATAAYQDHLAQVERRKIALRAWIDAVFLPLAHSQKPLMLEIGCGHGHFLRAYASARPQELCIGLDLLGPRLRKAQKRCEGLEHTVFVKAEAQEFLELLGPQLKLQSVYILFPDPWPKRKHAHNRLIQKEFISLLQQRMCTGAKVYFRTDYQPYFDWAIKRFEAEPDWRVNSQEPWPVEAATHFEALTGGVYASFVASLVAPAVWAAKTLPPDG